MIGNKSKIIEKLFLLLIKKFRHLLYKLDFKFYTNKVIYNKFINAFQDVFAYHYICFKLFDLLACLINNLYSLIITYQKTYLIKVFFTNCWYHKFDNLRQI